MANKPKAPKAKSKLGNQPKGKPKPGAKLEDVVHGPPFDVPAGNPPGGGAIDPFPGKDPFGVPGKG